MNEHPETRDADRSATAREAERQAAMAAAIREKTLTRWPNPCPVCFAEAGQRCLTRNGKRAIEHQERIRGRR